MNRGEGDQPGRRIEEFAWLLAIDPDLDLASMLVLMEALQLLPPRERQIVIWHYFDDLYLAEIARQEGLAGPTIREILQRALNRMRRSLGEE